GTVPDLLQRQRVRVGVGPALGERTEPAAGVADVGEVDVAGDDVGDVVAVVLAAQRVGDAGQRLQVRPVRGQQGEGLVVGEGGRVAFGLPEGGGGLAGPEDGGSAIAAGAQDAGGVCMRRAGVVVMRTAGGFSPGWAGARRGAGQAGPFGNLVPV